MSKINFLLVVFCLVGCLGRHTRRTKSPNILVIWGDDIGIFNISAYSHGMMGYQTPNIDRVANEGAIFTDFYAEQSCTAGRSSFITGQIPFRTGLSKVGMPGAKQGLSDKDPTLAELLKNHGYVSGQFGKNHLGDRNEYLPTVHGFDEYSGVLYHLNALEEPENVDYPKDPEFFAKFGPRDVIHSVATDTFDNTDEPRWGVVGKQKIDSRGQLTIKRMETFEDETLADSLDFIDRAVKAGKPFFVWHNSTRMHVNTHLRPKYQDMVAEKGFAGATITEFDDGVGALLKKLDDLGIADNTIVIVSTDNGAEKFSWPDGGTSPFRGEKATTYEGGFRVPAVIRWPGVVKPGTKINDIFHHMDWTPTFLSYLGEPDIKEKLKKGSRSRRQDLQGPPGRLRPARAAQGRGPGHAEGDPLHHRRRRLLRGPLREVEGPVHAAAGQWFRCVEHHVHLQPGAFCHRPAGGPVRGGFGPRCDHVLRQVAFPAVLCAGSRCGLSWVQFLKTFDEFPPRSKAASFSIGDALSSIETASQGQ